MFRVSRSKRKKNAAAADLDLDVYITALEWTSGDVWALPVEVCALLLLILQVPRKSSSHMQDAFLSACSNSLLLPTRTLAVFHGLASLRAEAAKRLQSRPQTLLAQENSNF